MKAREIRELSPDELDRRLVEQKAALFNLRMQIATGQLENVRRLGQVRRDIARIKTVQRAREQEQEHSEA